MDIDERLEESIENKYMQDDKGKNKMKLTAEESFYILKRRDFNSYVEEKAIQTVLEELDKKDKIINLIAEQLAGLTIWNNEKEEPLILMDKQEVIDYFTNKVEEYK